MSSASPPIPPQAHISPKAVGREVTITASQIQSPSPLYLQPEDILRFNARYPTFSTGNANIFLQTRFLLPNGEISNGRTQLTLTGVSSSVDVRLGEGFLLSAVIGWVTVAPNAPGALFVRASIIRDPTVTNSVYWTLISDYLTQEHVPSWPSGTLIREQDTTGTLRSITGSTPAAGAEITEAAPNNVRWRLICGSFTFTTNANVANRDPVFIIDDGINILYRWNTTSAITASSAPRLTFGSPNQPGVTDGTGQIIFIPDTFFMPPASRFRTLTGSIQAGDQYSAPQYLVQEWIEL